MDGGTWLVEMQVRRVENSSSVHDWELYRVTFPASTYLIMKFKPVAQQYVLYMVKPYGMDLGTRDPYSKYKSNTQRQKVPIGG